MNKVKKLISVLLAAVMILGMLPAISMSAAADGGFMEITSLLGNVTRKDGEVYLHLHINL